MASKLALFEFVNEDNVLDIGDSSRIVGVRKELLNNESWNFDSVCEVRWPGKNGRIDIVAARVMRFDEERSELKSILDRLLDGEDIAVIRENRGNLGRGHRVKRTAARASLSSDEENETPAVKRSKKSAGRAASEKRSDKDILSILKERNQMKAASRNSPEVATQLAVEDLRREIGSLKRTVTDLQETNKSLLALNESLVSTVKSLAGLPAAVDRLSNLFATRSSDSRPVIDRPSQCAISSTPHRSSRSPYRPRSPTPPPRSPTPPPRSPTPPSPRSPTPPPPFPSPSPIQPSTEMQALGLAAASLGPQNTGTPHNSMFSIPQSLLNSITKNDARKMTNDLLHGLYPDEYLAAHSVTGGRRAGGLPTKPPMDRGEIAQITKTVQKFFKEKTDAEVHYYMREKLNNVAKTLKRREDKRL